MRLRSHVLLAILAVFLTATSVMAADFTYASVAEAGYETAACQPACPAPVCGRDPGCSNACGIAACDPCGSSACGVAACDDCCDTIGPRWTLTADGIFMQRVGGRNIPLIRETGNNQVLATTNDLNYETAIGPRVSLMYTGPCGNSLEFNYFYLDDMNASVSASASNGVYFSMPNITVAAGANVPMQFDYASRLQNAELNLRSSWSDVVTVLAGVRWLEMEERMTGATIPVGGAPLYFGATNTVNHLYGAQIGTDIALWNRCGPFRIDALLKAGIYDNCATQNTYSPQAKMGAKGAVDRAAFIGEVGLIASYQINCNIALRAGYQLMWVDGLALASDQFVRTDITANSAPVDTGGNLLYHGAVAGVEVKF
jgi:hypothetical protein